jgi:hypothetical protein
MRQKFMGTEQRFHGIRIGSTALGKFFTSGTVLTDFSCSKELYLKAKRHIDRLSTNIATGYYEEIDKEV